ncbi:hypothetical protein EZ449_20700 [Pedobacter frigidisoli]|uniref:Uncharacterized protein n=1 Tax=Pedobacter frigidisoli TaxID=2530455 RepID=A0A4R0NK33_9SPHI|nr:hypothetical protein [Pedobacter frigidisoli]TCD00579.1 hypothetical protein EZ449_20700 [Pedobacter frigidisoli]
MIINKRCSNNDLDGVRIGDHLQDDFGNIGLATKVMITRYIKETHYYFSLGKERQTIFIIK